MEREEFFPPDEIFKEINDFIEKNGKPNYVWLKGNGEPSLYSGIKKLVESIKQTYPDLKIGSWLNGSLFYREDVRNDFLVCDLIIVHLDSIDPKEFLKISRHHKDVKLNNTIEGISRFKKSFKGRFGVSTVFLNGINANEKNLEELRGFLIEILPDLYMVQEFSNEKFKPIPEDFKLKIKEKFIDLPFDIVFNL